MKHNLLVFVDPVLRLGIQKIAYLVVEDFLSSVIEVLI